MSLALEITRGCCGRRACRLWRWAAWKPAKKRCAQAKK